MLERKLWWGTWWVVAMLALPIAADAVMLDAFGVKGGVAWMQPDFQYEGEELFAPDSIVTPVGGIFVEWKLQRRSRFNIVTELRYVEKGYSADRSILFETEPGDRKVIARYLSCPILLRSVVPNDGISLFLFFGPSLDFLLDSDDGPVIGRYRGVVLTGHAGLGLEKEIKNNFSWTVELRFNSEFSNAFDQPDEEPVARLESVRHYVLELQSGVRF